MVEEYGKDGVDMLLISLLYRSTLWLFCCVFSVTFLVLTCHSLIQAVYKFEYLSDVGYFPEF